MDSCYQPYILRVLVSHDADENFFPENFAPNDISLMIKPTETLIFVFSEEMIFLDSYRAKIGELVTLPYYNYSRIYVAAIGTDGSVDIEHTFTHFEKGKKYEMASELFALTPVTGKTGLATSPIDFMYADDHFSINPNNDRNIIYDLFLEPRIGALKVVTTNLVEWADQYYGESGLPSDEFTIVIGTTLDKYDLGGTEYGEQVSYQPPFTQTDASTISTPMFNLMPTQGSSRVNILIYRNNVPIYPAQGLPSFSYKVPPRAPYIIHLIFDTSETGFNVVPAQFRDIYIYQNFT